MVGISHRYHSRCLEIQLWLHVWMLEILQLFAIKANQCIYHVHWRWFLIMHLGDNIILQGWLDFPPDMASIKGGSKLYIMPDFTAGSIISVRIYNRYLFTTEAIGNWRANVWWAFQFSKCNIVQLWFAHKNWTLRNLLGSMQCDEVFFVCSLAWLLHKL